MALLGILVVVGLTALLVRVLRDQTNGLLGRTWWWALALFLLWVAFAVIYLEMPEGSFVQSDSTELERVLQRDQFGQELAASFQLEIERYDLEEAFGYPRVWSAGYDREQAQFIVRISNSSPGFVSPDCFDQTWGVSGFASETGIAIVTLLDSKGVCEFENESQVPPFLSAQYLPSFREFRDLEIAAQQADPTRLGTWDQRLVRMLYFSVVVVTTLGFGDIVPATDGARAAVMFEVLLGVLLIGLFLSSLALRAGWRRNTTRFE